jgi:hypothetical protein
VNADPITEFIQRQRRERLEAGLPASIIDTDALRLIAAVTGSKAALAAHYTAMAAESEVVRDVA